MISKIKNWIKSFITDELEEDEIMKAEHLEEEVANYFEKESIQIININPNVYLAERGAKICIGKTPKGSLNDRMQHLEKLIKIGHESILEHTNVIFLLRIPKIYIIDYGFHFVQFMSNLKYCNLSVRDKEDTYDILIGSSIRGLIHVLREIPHDNFFMKYIRKTIYMSCEKCFFINLFENNLLDNSLCNYLCDGDDNTDEEESVVNYLYEPEEIKGKRVDLVYSSPIDEILNKVQEYGFTLKDVYKVSTISFVFHNISRSCATQLIRHRAGISQESQRYVTKEYNKKEHFIDPFKEQEDRYNNSKYDQVKLKIKQQNPFQFYNYLISNNVHKEDARAYLPMNVITQVMMTFTYQNYAKFLKLRLDKAAQQEIRSVAEESSSLIFDPDSSKIQDFIEYNIALEALNPQYKEEESKILEQYKEIDEDVPENLDISSIEDAKNLLEKSERFSKIKGE